MIVPGFRVVFLLGDSQDKEISTSLKNEAKKFQDILISNIPDGYSTLSYKTITGLIWIRKNCKNAKFLTKIDDDVSMYWAKMRDELNQKYPNQFDPNVVECPSVMRNMPPWRPRKNCTNSIMSKWAVTNDEMSRRVYPDFCPGWAYVTSPSFGLKLAQAAATVPEMSVMNRLDDIFMTGYARERIPLSRVEQIKTGWSGYMWNNWLSECPFLGITKNIWFNDYVKAKGTYTKSFYFYLCAYLEFFILDTIDAMGALDLVPEHIANLCTRS